MISNLIEKINRLDEIRNDRPEELANLYQKVFSTVEGELILVDMMERFGEFKPSKDLFEAGNQAVLIYIKNRMLGIVEQPIIQEENL